MKKLLLLFLAFACVTAVHAQVTYYWVGGTNSGNSISTGSNWNTALDGSGTSRPSSTGVTDILVFNGTNVGGATPATGAVTVLANASISFGQMIFTNNANVSFIRASTGTSTMTVNGGLGDDFLVNAGSSFSVLPTTAGSIRFAMLAGTTGRVAGSVSIVTGQQFRFDNTTAGLPGSFVFTNGSSCTTNITSASSSYIFGSSSQSSEKWVVFENGSHIYYDGGYSPFGGTSTYSALDLNPGSVFHYRASNPLTGFGTFFSRKSYGHLSIESSATVTSDGPVYRIGNLTLDAGTTLVNYTSGQTAVMGNMTINGTFSTPAGSTNELVLAGTTAQTVSGTGNFNAANIIVANGADFTLARNINVDAALNVYGKLNTAGFQVTGAGNFTGAAATTAVTGTASMLNGAYMLTGNAGIATTLRGFGVTGTGIPANTVIIGFSSTGDSIYISNPVTATGTAVTLAVAKGNATLQTAHASGFGAAGGLAVTGTRTFQPGINYIVDAATTAPFGISTGAVGNMITAGSVTLNAPATANSGISVNTLFTLNAKLTLRPLDTLRLLSGSSLAGSFGANNYIITLSNVAGDLGMIQFDAISAATTVPVGSAANYLPVQLTPAGTSAYTVSVFEGITTNGNANGTALTPAQKQSVVNAIWQIQRLSGTGTTALQLNWTTPLEGATFTTLPGTDIGVIYNTGSSWSQPLGTGNNTTNTASANVSNFGAFSIGAVPPSQPFIFNAIPAKTYGNADFNAGATSLNTTQPIVYSSSNTAVASIVNGLIHINGAGTATITATQASDGFYPAASGSQLLTVNKAPLTITANNQTRFEQQANPTLTVTYTGFVLGENESVFTTPLSVSTTAVISSAPGTYPIVPSGAVAANYNITFVNGTLTVQAKQNQVITFNTLPGKTYGNADFSIAATSTNNTIPVTFTSSNPAVASIVNGNTIHINGAGTTNIIASQAGNIGYFPAADVSRQLVVAKAPLTVKAVDTSKIEGTDNPVLTVQYTGFVLNETPLNLTVQPGATTTATTFSAAGYYPITPVGGVSDNYSFNYITGRLTVYPASGTGAQYMNVFMSTANTLSVRIYTVKPVLGDIIVYDLAGREVARKNLFAPTGFITTNLGLMGTRPGLYIVTYKGPGVDLKRKITILN